MKIGFFITARLKSTRLKRKILLDLNGKTLLDRVIQRAKNSNGVDGIVLCTSTNPQDSELYQKAVEHKIQFFAGSEDDVLLRLYSAARYYGYDAFLSITADNPLLSSYHSSIIIDYIENGITDFVFPYGLPLGVVPYYIRTDALDVAIQMKNNSDTEIWGPYVNRPDFFNILDIEFSSLIFPTETRLTCDYTEDYNFLRQVFNHFPIEYEPSLFEIHSILKENPSLLRINSDLKQTIVPEKILETIKKQFEMSKTIGKDVIDRKIYFIQPGYKKLTL